MQNASTASSSRISIFDLQQQSINPIHPVDSTSAPLQRGPARSWPTATSAATWCHQVLHHSAFRCHLVPFSSLCSPLAAPSTPGPALRPPRDAANCDTKRPFARPRRDGTLLPAPRVLEAAPFQRVLVRLGTLPPQTFPSSFVQRHASRSFRHSFNRFRP